MCSGFGFVQCPPSRCLCVSVHCVCVCVCVSQLLLFEHSFNDDVAAAVLPPPLPTSHWELCNFVGRCCYFFFGFFRCSCAHVRVRIRVRVFVCVCRKYFTRCFSWASKALDCWVSFVVVAAAASTACYCFCCRSRCRRAAIGVRCRCRWSCYHFSCWLHGVSFARAVPARNSNWGVWLESGAATATSTSIVIGFSSFSFKWN